MQVVNCIAKSTKYNFLNPIESKNFPKMTLERLLQIAPNEAAHVRTLSSMLPKEDPKVLKELPKNVLNRFVRIKIEMNCQNLIDLMHCLSD